MAHAEEIKEYLEIEKSLQSHPKNNRFIIAGFFEVFVVFNKHFTQRGKFIEE